MLENSLYPGVLECLTAVRDAGVRLAVATSKPEVYARRITAHFGIDDLVEGALKQQRLLATAPVEVTADDLATVFRESLEHW